MLFFQQDQKIKQKGRNVSRSLVDFSQFFSFVLNPLGSMESLSQIPPRLRSCLLLHPSSWPPEGWEAAPRAAGQNMASSRHLDLGGKQTHPLLAFSPLNTQQPTLKMCIHWWLTPERLDHICTQYHLFCLYPTFLSKGTRSGRHCSSKLGFVLSYIVAMYENLTVLQFDKSTYTKDNGVIGFSTIETF